MKCFLAATVRGGVFFAWLAGALWAGNLLAADDILQPLAQTPVKTGDGNYYVPSTSRTVQWGVLPNRDREPVLTVPSGSVVTFDTVSHEGVLEDQGRDPVPV